MSGPALPAPVLHRSGDGPPVLMLHPLGVDHRFWDGVVPALPGFEVLTYDFPGHGATPVPGQPYTVEDLADQAAALLREAGAVPADVVGVSLGGLVAQRLAAGAPDLVRRLVVVDAVSVYPDQMRQMWRERAERAPREGLEPFVDPTLALWFTAGLLAEGGPVVEQARRAFLAGDPAGYGLACRALEAADLTGDVGQITAPTLVVCGEDDAPPFTAAARELAGQLPGAQLVWLSPARHAGVLEQPEQFATALRGFLRSGGAA
ncbi:alpha/beta fold hydrolase [Geodermatophilus sp. YIM 151500]|uniref:alpha/beta fold hydrolase n=1 Tax=Geodermatophilus sp. YIM 151500 TaxID=2984531 RepID=UPI0021E41AE3|nr:alpha/beta fold hydrolase [Geodermatophilus sp. YIM 151500]MCV2488844.1 alpha/beta fold hydrolase [Geodermatophilus sp. YIM 151500]